MRTDSSHEMSSEFNKVHLKPTLQLLPFLSTVSKTKSHSCTQTTLCTVYTTTIPRFFSCLTPTTLTNFLGLAL